MITSCGACCRILLLVRTLCADLLWCFCSSQCALSQRDVERKASTRAALQEELTAAKAALSREHKARPCVEVSSVGQELERAARRMEEARVAWEAEVKRAEQGLRQGQQAQAHVALLQARVDRREAAVREGMGRLMGGEGQWDEQVVAAERERAARAVSQRLLMAVM